jgi:uncharacterized protein YjiK
MMNRYLLLLTFVLAMTAVVAWGRNEPAVPASTEKQVDLRQWQLPKFLREASGLAVYDENYLLAHNDEKGNIYRISIDGIVIEKLASINKPPIRKDFEGIAIAGDSTYLITSSGVLYRVDDLAINRSKQVVAATVIDTGVGEQCEIEGLHYLDGELLFPCKTLLQQKETDRLLIFSYSIETGETREFLSLEKERLAGIKKVMPTALDATATHYYVVSDRRLLMIDRNTLEVRAFSLPKKLHFKTEGIAILENGAIILVDDNSEGLSRLTRYGSYRDLKEKTKP